MTTILPHKATKQLNAAYKTAYKKTDSLPVLTHFHIYTHDNRLIVESFNLETASREKIECKIENEINICVPARAFKDWISVLAKNYPVPVNFKMDAKLMMLYAEIPIANSRTSFKCIDPDEFPAIDQFLPA